MRYYNIKIAAFHTLLLVIAGASCGAQVIDSVPLKKIAPHIVKIEAIGGSVQTPQYFTGIIVKPDTIVTASYNLRSEPTSLIATLPDGTKQAVKVKAENGDTKSPKPLASLLCQVPTQLPPPSTRIQVGQKCYAAGYNYVSSGIVSAVQKQRLLCDCAVGPQNYGGALLDEHGNFLGILVPLDLKMPGMDASELYDCGIGTAIPIP